MRHGSTATPAGHRTGAHQERSLNQVTFIGSFPRADFALKPSLPEIAFVGRSNVGKSSLINAVLARKTIARTSKTPGKTRECNVFQVAAGFYLVDLPGYGYAKVSKKEHHRLASLLERYLEDREPLAGVVWLLDIRRDLSPDDEVLGRALAERETPALIVLTKADKLSARQQGTRTAVIADQLGVPPDQVLVTSSTKKTGIDDLRESIRGLLDD